MTIFDKKRNLFPGLKASLFVLCIVSAAMGEPPTGCQWKLVWNDEFNGTSLDTSKWGCRGGIIRDGLFVEKAVTLDGQGNLVLRTWEKNGQAYGGAVTTSGRFSHRYGYYEARCILPKHKGHWTAFWLQTPRQNIPPYEPAIIGSEADIFEYFKVGTNTISHNVHWGCSTDFYEHMGHEAEVPGLKNDGYHIFGLLWTPKEYIFYVDGHETWRTSRGVSNHDLYILLSDQILYKGVIAGMELPDDFKYQEDYFKIDYVRVYDQVDEYAPPADKRGNFLQIIEVGTTPKNAKRLRKEIPENLSEVSHSPNTQIRQFPLIDLKGNGEICAMKFRDNKPVIGFCPNDIPCESLDMFCGCLEFLKNENYDVCPVLHLQMNMERLAGWITDSSGKKKPVMRHKQGYILRQLLNPGTWYILSDTNDPVLLNGKTVNENVLVLYRLFTVNDLTRKIIPSTQAASPTISARNN